MYIYRYPNENWKTFTKYEEKVDNKNVWQYSQQEKWNKTYATLNDNFYIASYNEITAKYNFNLNINEFLDNTFIPSKFNLKIKKNGNTLFYNTSSEAFVLLDNSETILLDDLLFGKKNESFFNFFNALFSLGFFVNVSENENLKLEYIRNRCVYSKSKIKNFEIFLTHDCNAKCFFCFDAINENRKMMSITTANEIVSFICSVVEENDEIVFRWFGGEPLMATAIIDHIVNNIKNKLTNINFYSIITTNGSLLNENIIETAVRNWNLKKIILTIDGYKHEHNRRKNYSDKNFDGYQHILNQIDLLLKADIYVICRLNIDNRNLYEIPNILDDLIKYSQHSNFMVYYAYLQKTVGVENFDNINQSQVGKTFTYLTNEFFSKGFYKSLKELLPKVHKNLCYANNMISIDANGRLYKCTQQPKLIETSIGDCKKGVVHNDNLAKWLDTKLSDQCEECSFMPICQGGCKYYNMQNDNQLHSCHNLKYYYKELFDMIYEKFIAVNP